MDVLPVELWLSVTEYVTLPQYVVMELLDDELTAELREGTRAAFEPDVRRPNRLPIVHERPRGA